ncbi:syntaphilin [Chanos chanos]|uniref:Syntaphilin n=1 Tax=Chanos chanos TaxID=29144 RepID=A0A6J2UYD9_CHACN|nr:syntaphilin [Chanos chanos]
MSASANKKSGAGSRRFNPLKALQPKWRLQQILSSPSTPPPFDYCRFIELDYIPMEAGIMVSMRQSRGFLTPKSPEHHCRRSPAPVSNRDPYGNASLSSGSNSGSCKGSDGSPTPRRPTKYTSCTDNHGIKPPPPEQYLTPLQQKEVCIRHLRARLKETIERLQDRDSEIDELRTQLTRMQEDWIEEECHRVEAELALKEARREIQQLKQVVDVVHSSLGETDTGVQKCFQDISVQNHKLETLLHNMELAQNRTPREGEVTGGRVGGGSGGRAGVVEAELEVSQGLSGSCDGSPARSLTRSSTYTKLSDQGPVDRNGNGNPSDYPCLSADGTQDSGFVCCGESAASRADLLLEAALLSEETASLLSTYSRLPHSSTYEKLCTGDRVVPLRCGASGGSISHPCLSHHHLYLHHLREQAIQTDYAPASAPVHPTTTFNSDLDTIAERTFRSQACSPTSTWVSDEGEDLDSVTTASVTAASILTTSATTAPLIAAAVGTDSSAMPADPVVSAATSLPTAVSPMATSPEPVATAANSAPPTAPLLSPVSTSCSVEASSLLEDKTPLPHTSQPKRSPSAVEQPEVTVVEVEEEDKAEEVEEELETASSSCGPPVKSYWSRHFLVDLLAVAVPVVPTVAWLCRGPRRDGQPIYHIGSLLRGCCTVALHSLRRGAGLRHYPAGGGGPGGTYI